MQCYKLKRLYTLLFFIVAFQTILPQSQLEILPQWKQHSDAPNSLYHHIAKQAYSQLSERNKIINELDSLSDWKGRQSTVSSILNDILGPFPAKTPLNAKITRTIDKGSYRLEHIVFESQPGLYVTSTLFIPKFKKEKKLPSIIYCSGHDSDGYHGNYQQMILNLVAKGFIVFAFDPIDQGERLENDDRKNKTFEIPGWHSYLGAQALIVGSSQAKYMIWDGIRAIDYLISRKEVDPNRIGITGRSGGGTQSAQIAAMDHRIYACAPENYITNYTRLFQSIGPQDAEQNLYHAIAKGIDHADLLSVRAPKPALIIGTTNDIFSIQGFRETAEEVSKVYQAYGKEDNFNSVEDVFIHGSTKKNNEAMYSFFQRHLNNPGTPEEEEVQFLGQNEIRVTPTGQVSSSLKGNTIFDLNRKEAKRLSGNIENSRKNLTEHLSQVLISAKNLAGIINPSTINEPVFSGRIEKESYVIDKYFVKGEGDYVIPYLLIIPNESSNKALLYISPSGKPTEADESDEIKWFVDKGFTVLAPDMIGIGEMGPIDLPKGSNINGVSYSIWFASMLVGRSILGIRTGDLMRLTNVLDEINNIKEIYALAKNEMSPLLLHAAAFDSRISRIALVDPLTSYSSLVYNRYYDPRFVHSIVPGALTSYDLPDIAGTLAPRKLMIVGLAGGGSPTKTLIENQDMGIIRKAYKLRNASHQFKIKLNEPEKVVNSWFSDWIK